MMTCSRSASSRSLRKGYTLLEVLVVMLILVVLGAIAVPSMRALSGNTKTQAAADMVRSRLATARASAMEQGIPHTVVVSPDGTQVRVKVSEQYTASPSAAPATSADALPETVQVEMVVQPSLDESHNPYDSDGWLRFVTYLPDGTCDEDSAAVRVSEPGQNAMIVKVRGLTGAYEVTPDAE